MTPEKVAAFLNAHPFPTFEEVEERIRPDIAQWSEHGEFNHEQVRRIYENIDDLDMIKEAGRLIGRRGGPVALQANFYTFLEVMRM